MYWTDVLYMHVLHWCVIFTGLVRCCMYWTGVMLRTGLHVTIPNALISGGCVNSSRVLHTVQRH